MITHTPHTSPVIGYTGEVSTKVIKNGRVLKSSSGKNNGLPQLFTALCHALTGQVQTNVMPARLVLYSYSGTTVTNASRSVIGDTTLTPEEIIKKYWRDIQMDEALEALTTPLLYTNPPEVIEGPGGNPRVRLEFKIPYTVIKNATTIKLAVLYPNKSSKTLTLNDALAFYFLDKEECAPPPGKENAHLLLNWEMYFLNSSVLDQDADFNSQSTGG